MSRQGETIREFLLDSICQRPESAVQAAIDRFDVSRQAIHMHLRKLIADGLVEARGRTRARTYRLAYTRTDRLSTAVAGLEEDRFWRQEVKPGLPDLPGNVVDIWHYGFTEMINNVIDHSSASTVAVAINQTARTVEASISDDGTGIFRKIKEEIGLEDERHAVLELAKGKLTTDPERHTGEGIFFTSRMFDDFAIVSGDVVFTHHADDPTDWIHESGQYRDGTTVFMGISNRSARTDTEVFERFASAADDYAFTKTVVPVRLARYGDEQLVSRSQARRLLARVDRFRTVILDFTNVGRIGQAFADEVFRVFVREHPAVEIVPANTSQSVKRMIARARRESSLLP